MTKASFYSSRPDQWTAPRANSDPSLRFLKYGRVRPMKEDRGFWQRLFSRD